MPVQGSEWFIVDTDHTVVSRYQRLLGSQQIIRDDFVGSDAVRRFAGEYPKFPRELRAE